VLLLHGREDEIVPVAHVRRLADAFSPAATVCIAEGCGHNSPLSSPGYDAALSKFLAAASR